MTTQVFRKVFAAVLFVAVVANVSAQQTKKEKPGVKKANIGVTVNAHDYDTKTIFPKEDSAYGFSVLFWKGITPKVDYSIRYNGIFPNENKNSVISKNGISNELELAAALFGLEEAQRQFPGEPAALFSDNQDAVVRLARAKAEGLAHDPALARMLAERGLASVPECVSVCWVQGHATCRGNALADQHARAAAG